MNKIKLAINSLVTFFIYLVGGIDKVFICLVILMILDYITGLLKGIKNKNLNSKKGFEGIIYKFCILFMIMLAEQIDIVTNQDVFRNLICYFFISNEGISLLENFSILGLPVPEKIKNLLEQLKKE
jgi:toxin secretion/phage lysis holin